MTFVSVLHRAASRENLTVDEAREAMGLVLSGQATAAQIAAFLVALRMKGETVDELLGFAQAMRERCVPVPVETTGEALLDTCGTGGDGLSTFNISTVAALVVAGAGVRVAKHGNRSISSHCGSADILESLGVNINLTVERMARSVDEVGFGFLYAPAIHPAMKHAQPARLEIKMRTAFNYLGPLTNPAGATAQLAGVPSVRAAELVAETLARLGLARGFVVHGLDGLDEITTTAETLVLEIRRGAIAQHTLSVKDFGLKPALLEDLKGADLRENTQIAIDILHGAKGPKRDIVLANASAALVAADKASDFRHGVDLAALSIDSGAALAKLEALAAFTQRKLD